MQEIAKKLERGELSLGQVKEILNKLMKGKDAQAVQDQEVSQTQFGKDQVSESRTEKIVCLNVDDFEFYLTILKLGLNSLRYINNKLNSTINKVLSKYSKSGIVKTAILELISEVGDIVEESNKYVLENILKEYELSSEEVEKLKKGWIQFLTSELECIKNTT